MWHTQKRIAGTQTFPISKLGGWKHNTVYHKSSETNRHQTLKHLWQYWCYGNWSVMQQISNAVPCNAVLEVRVCFVVNLKFKVTHVNAVILFIMLFSSKYLRGLFMVPLYDVFSLSQLEMWQRLSDDEGGRLLPWVVPTGRAAAADRSVRQGAAPGFRCSSQYLHRPQQSLAWS